MNAIIVSALLGVILMFCSWGFKSESLQKNIALVGLLVLIAANLAQLNGWYVVDINTKGMLAFSRFGLYANTLLFAITFLYLWINAEEIEAIGHQAADFYALFFFILCGASILTSFDNLLMLFIGIEILSIPLYILTGSDKKNLLSNEASLKYFLMGSFSTGILLLGITLCYGAIGSFRLEAPIIIPSKGMALEQYLLSAGLILIFAAMNFKVSAAPFHFWTPDVYDGAPTVFTSFMATIVKAAGFIAFISIFHVQAKALGYSWMLLLTFVIIATLLVGNISAVFQRSVKRMLAYSSIAQAGFMMLAILSLNVFAKQGLLLYFAGYSIATLGIFAVLVKMKDHSVDAFNGLSKTNPMIALSVLISLLSLAGIPMTAGFFAKYYMLLAVIREGHLMWLVVTAVLCAAVSVYYYFRVIQAMYFKEPSNIVSLEFPAPFKWMMIINAILIIILGIHPDFILNLI